MAKHKFNDEEVSGALDQAEIDSENEDDSEEPLPAGGKLGKFIQIQRIAFSKQNVYYAKVLEPLKAVTEMDRKKKEMVTKYLLRVELIGRDGKLSGIQKDLLSITAMTGCFEQMDAEDYVGKCFKFSASKQIIQGKTHKGFQLQEYFLADEVVAEQ